MRALPDGRLWLLRDAYAAETAWAPRHVGRELRLSRLGAFNAGPGAIRAVAEADAARKAGDHARAGRHEDLAASYRALHDRYQQREQALAQAMASRQEWEHVTAGSRHLAIATDAELRRRHPGQKIEPLRSAEPAPVSEAERQHLDLIPHQGNGQRARIRDLGREHQASRTKTSERWPLVPAEDAAWGSPGTASPASRPHGGRRSCSRPSRRSPHRQKSSSSLRSTTSSPKLGANHCLSRRSGQRFGRTHTVSLGICIVRAAMQPNLREGVSAIDRERPLVTGVDGPLMARRPPFAQHRYSRPCRSFIVTARVTCWG